MTDPLPTAMRAAVVTRYGGPESMALVTRPLPTPRPGEYLVRIRAAGLNPIDYRIRQGQLRWLLPTRLPVVLGYDIAGEIVAGNALEEANALTAGTRVLSYLPHRLGGGYAQYTTVKAAHVIPLPDGLSWEQAAAVPLAASTALQALRDIARAQPGQRVVIHGASGGVGHFAVQIAKSLGTHVTAVCSAANLDFVRNLGADVAIDYRERDILDTGESYDAIFDVVANRSFAADRGALHPGGSWITTVPRLASLGWNGVTWFGRRCRHILARSRHQDLAHLVELIRDNRMQATVQQVYDLEDIAAAHRVLEAHHVRGKLVLRIE